MADRPPPPPVVAVDEDAGCGAAGPEDRGAALGGTAVLAEAVENGGHGGAGGGIVGLDGCPGVPASDRPPAPSGALGGGAGAASWNSVIRPSTRTGINRFCDTSCAMTIKSSAISGVNCNQDFCKLS